MKRILSILVLVVAVSIQANAQDGQRGPKKGQNMTAEQIATLGSKKMTLGLDLTASQEKQVYNLLEAQAKDRNALRTQHQEMRKNNEKPSDEDRFNFQVAQLDKQIAFKAEMKKILNNDQYEKWAEMAAKRKQKMNKKGSQERRKPKGNRGN